MVEDLRFKRHRPNKDSINYRCKTSGCTSSVTIKAEKVTYWCDLDQEIEHIKLSTLDYAKIEFRQSFFEAVRSDDVTPTQQLFDNPNKACREYRLLNGPS